MDFGLVGIAIVGIVFFLQLHFRLKKIELKLISLDLRIDSLESDRASLAGDTREAGK